MTANASPALGRLSSHNQAIKIERYVRGFGEYRHFRSSDVIVASFGKSGRTWLRVLLSRYYQQKLGLPINLLIEHDNFRRLEPAAPRIHFTHDNYIRDFLGPARSKSIYAGRKTVLLVRHPVDIAVSQYFQWKHRMKPRKRLINKYPALSEDLSICDFVCDERSGLPKIVRFLNDWIDALPDLPDIRVIRYESLSADTASVLASLLEFFGEQPSVLQLEDCVNFASIENMRAMEASRFFEDRTGRMKARDAADPNSFKVRRAVAGGYRDYFDKDQLASIENYVRTNLKEGLGYASSALMPNVL